MKKYLAFLGALILFASCSEYQTVLKNDDVSEKYNLGLKYYDEAKANPKGANKKYRKAINLFEQVLPQYRGKPQGEKLAYIYSDAYYELEDYFLSGYQFERFTKAYPASERVEEAYFKSAVSYYNLSPRYTLEQSDTDKALVKLQDYFSSFPEGKYLDEANTMTSELRIKLDKKAYEIAKQYHHTEYYKAAIEAFDNYLVDNPGSSFKEKALYYKFESAYLLAINSYSYLVEDRLRTANQYYENYLKYYPDGELSEEAKIMKLDIDTRLQDYI